MPGRQKNVYCVKMRGVHSKRGSAFIAWDTGQAFREFQKLFITIITANPRKECSVTNRNSYTVEKRMLLAVYTVLKRVQ